MVCLQFCQLFDPFLWGVIALMGLENCLYPRRLSPRFADCKNKSGIKKQENTSIPLQGEGKENTT